MASSTPGAPEWYLLRHGKKLDEERARFDRLEQYDSGDHPLPSGNRKMRETYRRFQQMARSNYTGLIAEAVRERIRPSGFISGADGSRKLDKAAWGIWQANSLDADCGIVHHKALSLSRSYAIVGPNPDDPSKPYITAEDPRQVIHEYDPVRPRKVVAALKTWFDPLQGRQVAIVYLPDGFYYFRYTSAGNGSCSWDPQNWEVDDSQFEDGRADNPIGEVPVVPFINRRERGGMGEFEDVTDVMDRVNATILDRLVIQAMQAYRQRWAKGVEVEDKDGNPERPFDPGADLLWVVPDDNAQFGDFQATDIKPIISASSADIRDLAAISRTPPHYLLADVQNVSGDALTAVESGLVQKVRDRCAEFGEGWEKVIRLAGLFAGVVIADDCSLVWHDPERRTLAALADAAVKYQDAGVPFRERMRLLGFDEQTIDRLAAERIHDALIEALNSPIGVAPGAAPATAQLPLTSPGSPPAPAAPAPPVAK